MRGRKPDAIVTGSDSLTAVPNAPAWLNKDAKAEWRRTAPILVLDRKTLTIADLPTLTSYCVAVGQVAEASRKLASEGMTFMGASGPKRHPLIGILNDAMNQGRLLANELGLTPVSRSRPSIRDEGGDGDDDQLSALGL